MSLPLAPSGQFDGSQHLYPVRVYFEDTDLSAVVYHANYLRWFERARSDMLRLLGIDQRAAHEAGEGAYAVSEMNLRYLRPAKLDDEVLIRSHVDELSPATCWIVQRAFRNETLLCEARVRVAFVAPNGRPRRQPREWMAAFQTIATAPEGQETA
ncbi:thioesterase [Novosphingobium sp. THN1]|jgi:acyl-CoA thioester hydrolase|uniref:YbgC/FadM family acyl-CoA thioesterase n=1 Tax=unclassified Novosphingobium TaxID=2644732 RepID=UPI000E46C89C|nr:MULTISPECIES: YbgC/FadM family acyl-CoA thioesterase [unclassified Novosphingobium]AXU17955.1 thioesterase [Novosphingobium sp. THN1]MBA4086280.1 thioesterase [Novosphingobium sp.]NLR37700.1 YbgC/FadM family acyl-CoA thioesterase [Novosphingobium sp. ERW19]